MWQRSPIQIFFYTDGSHPRLTHWTATGVLTGPWIQFPHPSLRPLHTAIIPRAWYQVHTSGKSHIINSFFGMSLLFLFPAYNQLVKLHQNTKQTVMFWITRFLIIAPVVLSMLHINPCTLIYSQNLHLIFVKLFVVPDTQPVSWISESMNDWMNDSSPLFTWGSLLHKTPNPQHN